MKCYSTVTDETKRKAAYDAHCEYLENAWKGDTTDAKPVATGDAIQDAYNAYVQRLREGTQ